MKHEHTDGLADMICDSVTYPFEIAGALGLNANSRADMVREKIQKATVAPLGILSGLASVAIHFVPDELLRYRLRCTATISAGASYGRTVAEAVALLAHYRSAVEIAAEIEAEVNRP